MLTQNIKLLEIVIMVIAVLGFWLVILVAICRFISFGAKSTFFGPIKYAYLPEVMHKDELVGANGLFQAGTSLAILTGMMMAGVLTLQPTPPFGCRL